MMNGNAEIYFPLAEATLFPWQRLRRSSSSGWVLCPRSICLPLKIVSCKECYLGPVGIGILSHFRRL